MAANGNSAACVVDGCPRPPRSVEDRCDDHSYERTQDSTPPRHVPTICRSIRPGVWNVYCWACSAEADWYVYPCKEGHDFPPRQLVDPEASI